MSLLAPLYLLAGLAIGLPILVHLIRRRPKAEMTFSSLMFLRESPPQLTKRSRLDDLPLLLLRALALILLAVAFARPFLRSAQTRSAEAIGRKMVLMIDTSASMRREGIAEAIEDRVDEFVRDLQPGDAVAVVAFDREPRIAMSFDRAAGLDLDSRKTAVRETVWELAPTWSATDLGSVLTLAADEANNYIGQDRGSETGGANADPSLPIELGIEGIDEATAEGAPANLVLVSDLQTGASLTSLQSYVWPENVRVDLRVVEAESLGNASARPLRQDSETQTSAPEKRRIRVSNAEDATDADFEIAWGDENALPRSASKSSVQVPPGQSRVVTLPAPLPGDSSLLLLGDGQEFDNTYYFSTPKQRELRLLFIGAESADNRDDLAFYLEQVPLGNARRQVTLERFNVTGDQPWSTWQTQLSDVDFPTRVPLIVVGTAVSSDIAESLRSYAEAGGHVLAVVGKQEDYDGWRMVLATISGLDSIVLNDADVDEYAILSQIDFLDPLFVPMADPKFNDFSKLRFWSHRHLSIDGGDIDSEFTVPARFDDGHPALVRRSVGQGKLSLLMSGWQPAESQLALSTKFIPLVYGWFEPTESAKSTQEDFVVGETDALSSTTFEEPGVVTITRDRASSEVAVNLAADESKTAKMDPAELEALGVRLGRVEKAAETAKRDQQLRDIELENQQSLWRILLVVAVGLLATETLWSARRNAYRQETK